jgi:hypothetical protein
MKAYIWCPRRVLEVIVMRKNPMPMLEFNIP